MVFSTRKLDRTNASLTKSCREPKPQSKTIFRENTTGWSTEFVQFVLNSCFLVFHVFQFEVFVHISCLTRPKHAQFTSIFSTRSNLIFLSKGFFLSHHFCFLQFSKVLAVRLLFQKRSSYRNRVYVKEGVGLRKDLVREEKHRSSSYQYL